MLEKMRQAATEQAKRAAEAAQRTALTATDRAGEAAAKGLDRAVAAAHDPANQAKAKLAARQAASATARGAAKGATGAGKAVKSALDKLNPELLAGVVIKATALQEQANASLKKSGSLYRISGIAIGAAFPPSVTFQIGRLSDIGREEMIEQPENAFLEVPDIPEIATSDGAG